MDFHYRDNILKCTFITFNIIVLKQILFLIEAMYQENRLWGLISFYSILHFLTLLRFHYVPGSTFLLSCLFSWDIVSLFSTDVLCVTLACPVILIHPLQHRCYYNWGSMVYLQQYCEMSLNMRLTEELIFIRLKRSEMLHVGIWFKAVWCYCEPSTCMFVPT